ncbi:MAG TPA: hypothetical protein VJV75_07695 [Candidatus Polarisedimenticolia bacterium]|nr:hypothetical protein [Candidatus Polarisedimenticolia bacterium]
MRIRPFAPVRVPAAAIVLAVAVTAFIAAHATAQNVQQPGASTSPATSNPPATSSTQAQPVSRPLSCDLAEYRQFDFWIGEWDVFQPDGTLVGTNRITLILGTCVLLENWKGKSGMEGWSFNNYDRAERKWHQNWVDSHGSRLDLVGALVGKNMVLSGDQVGTDGTTTMNRITWEPIDANRVRQLWEQSKDGGKTWTVAFDGQYVRHGSGASASGNRRGR